MGASAARQSATGIPAGDLDSFGPAASPANNPPGDRHQRMPEGKRNMGVWFLVSWVSGFWSLLPG